MRYLKVTLLIGFVVSGIVAGLYALDVFAKLDNGLWSFLGSVSEPPRQRAPVQLAAVVFLAFGIAWTTVDINRPPLKAVVAAAALVQVLGLPWVLNLSRHFFSPFPGALAIALSFGAAFAYSRSGAGKRKRVLHAVFGPRLSRKSFNDLVDSDAPVNLRGELREATIVVCEVFNHDDLAGAMPVSDYVAMMNGIFNTGAEFLVEKGGYLDECDGESLRVIFGAPVGDNAHAAKACEAALALAQRLENLNMECENKWHKTFDFRIGTDSGEVVAAAYGSRRLGSFSVAGEPVESARKLCSANRIYGSRILIGPDTFALAAESVEVRPIEMIRWKSGNALEEIYELVAMKNAFPPDLLQKRDLFWKGVVYYRGRQWEEALDHFQAALTMSSGDAPVEFYIRRIERLRTGTPAPDWESAKI